jgi:hypothetical protein
MNECSFKLNHYYLALEAYRKAGYTFADFAAYFNMLAVDSFPNKLIVLRHDVDFSIFNARGFAYAESANAVHSTYFLRLHSPSYNALSSISLDTISLLHHYRATFGLHIEPDMVDLAEIRNPEQWLMNCIDLLNSVLPSELCAASLHCVDKGATDTQWIVDACEEWGLPLVSHDMPGLKYLSDSNGRWREGCFCQWIDKEPRLHVCTHPVWWFHNSPQENY